MINFSFLKTDLDALSPANPVKVITAGNEGEVECLIIAFDTPGVFSLIAGVLSSSGMAISQGDVTTPKGEGRRKIADHFLGTLEKGRSFKTWSRKITNAFHQLFPLLEEPMGFNKAREMVNKMVARELTAISGTGETLYPAELEVDNSGEFTTLKVIAQDTPYFLYSFSRALYSQNITIEFIRITTRSRLIEDLFTITHKGGKKITDKEILDRVKLTALLTKQFTAFLKQAPDPYAAFHRFESLVEEVLKLPRQGHWTSLLSEPETLKELARLLGASDFLWEDFIRRQYEALLPLFSPHREKENFSLENLTYRLHTTLEKGSTLEEKEEILNLFKDRESFKIDMNHILSGGKDFRIFSKHLTQLAECVINSAWDLVYEKHTMLYGRPRSFAGLETTCAILGLGKLGGRALGYASDIEVLFVYSDQGETRGGKESISNSRFFHTLVKEFKKIIKAKKKGIFEVDLRLRPYGKDGPLAVSLERFCVYYGPGGEAHDLEKLALVRLRVVGGDKELGLRLQRLRDEYLYLAREGVSFRNLKSTREKQFAQRNKPGHFNAKFSPGALVDLEYDVQILQVIYGREHRELRTPSVTEALKQLSRLKVIPPEEGEMLLASYAFFRNLINGLRMLRGSALDLFLPETDSEEFLHLARRMGYEDHAGLLAPDQLKLDFNRYTAVIRIFVKNHFGRDALPGPPGGNIVDLLMARSPDPDPELGNAVLKSYGFKNIPRAGENIRILARRGELDSFIPLAVLAMDIIKRTPDPDMALNNWERFNREKSDWSGLLARPRVLEIQLLLFSSSQYLADILIENREFLERAEDPEKLNDLLDREGLYRELKIHLPEDREQRLQWLRKIKGRETLRIAIRDICLKKSTQAITLELSLLAEVFIQVAYESILKEMNLSSLSFTILAFGKLGGEELNYSSDIDLLGIYTPPAEARVCAEVMEKLREVLQSGTAGGQIYRVDFRLRPHGIAGPLTFSLNSIVKYYENDAALWEIQALLKLRPVGGDPVPGYRFLEKAAVLFGTPPPGEEVWRVIRQMRGTKIKQNSQKVLEGDDIKNGPGSLRDIEFLTQGLQLIHLPRHPRLLEKNTLLGLETLQDLGILVPGDYTHLEEAYLFFRKTEHCLQLMDDRQTSILPREKEELAALSRRLLGSKATPGMLITRLEETRSRVRKICERYMNEDQE